MTQSGHQSSTDSPGRCRSIDALSRWVVNGKDNHVVVAEIAQRMLRARFDLAYTARRYGLRLSVDCYIACSAYEIEQMAPRFDMRNRMITRFETNQFRIESGTVIGI